MARPPSSRMRAACARDPTTTNLRPSEQRLIALTRQLRFGALPSIPVRKGDLMLEATARRQRRVRLGQPELAASSETADFKLKRHHLDLIERVRQIDWGTVTIEVQDGLPVHLVIEEEVGT